MKIFNTYMQIYLSIYLSQKNREIVGFFVEE